MLTEGAAGVEKLYVAFVRAERSVGGQAEIDCPLFQVEFAYQLSLVEMTEMLEELSAAGTAEIQRIDKRGHRRWSLVAA